MTDRITRLRDKHGNRLPWFYSYLIPVVGNKPLEETPYFKLIEHIEESYPLRAARLHGFYNGELLEALKRLAAVSQEADEALTKYNAHVIAKNAAIEGEQTRLSEQRDAKTRIDRED